MPDPAEAPGDARRVVVAGASGLIGRALVDSLRADGFSVTTLVRRPTERDDEVEWLTDAQPLDPDVLAGADAVVGLNGANLGRMPWTPRYKSALVWSRITPTRALAAAVRALGSDAPAFVSGSAVGFYGSVPGAKLTERSERGDTFLAELCGEWESAAHGAGPLARVATIRTAPLIHPDGVLKPLLVLTMLGVSGPLGRGTQVWPWLSLEDEVRAIRHIIGSDIAGAVNLAGPARATANDIGFALARRLNRPYALRAPAWAIRLGLGADAAEGLLLTDADVVPAVLEATGFSFRHPTIDDAIAAAVPARD